ncbi:MAG: Phage integrase family protein [Rhodospirillales bacterium]|nr:Phage integrase family protein [Rhodospirillales bacterium]
MRINRHRYFYSCAFGMFGDHLVVFVDEMVEHDHAESTVKIYLSCINDVAKAMHAAGMAPCDLDETRATELVAAMGWIQSRETYARFMMKRFVRFLAVRGVTRERPALSPRGAISGKKWSSWCVQVSPGITAFDVTRERASSLDRPSVKLFIASLAAP